MIKWSGDQMIWWSADLVRGSDIQMTDGHLVWWSGVLMVKASGCRSCGQVVNGSS
jgi:hypothetical protein